MNRRLTLIQTRIISAVILVVAVVNVVYTVYIVNRERRKEMVHSSRRWKNDRLLKVVTAGLCMTECGTAGCILDSILPTRHHSNRADEYNGDIKGSDENTCDH
jgi:hypothetical protein